MYTTFRIVDASYITEEFQIQFKNGKKKWVHVPSTKGRKKDWFNWLYWMRDSRKPQPVKNKTWITCDI